MSAAIARASGTDPMMLDTPATKGTAVTAAMSTGGSDGNTALRGHPSTAAGTNNSNDESGAGQAPTQIKLSISQADAARMLDASRSFNEALRTIQEERSAAAATDKANGTSTADGSTGEGAAADIVMSEAKKKQPAKGASKAGGATAGGTASEQQQPQEPQARSPSPMEESNDEGVRTKPSFSPGRANNNSSGHTSSSTSTKKTSPLHTLLVPAAERCTDSFIQSYLEQMRADGVSQAEMEARLLLFLDMDKSGKLVSAFVILGGGDGANAPSSQEDGKGDAMDCSDGASDGDDEIVVPGPLSYGTVSALLRSFLTSISICIHRKEGTEAGASVPASTTAPKPDAVSSTPPSKAAKSTGSASPHSAVTSANSGADYPWQMDDAKDEIAKFATDRLADHIRSTSTSEAVDADGGVSFEAFGDWYNSGGFKLIPWIELLDLAKWDTLAGPLSPQPPQRPSLAVTRKGGRRSPLRTLPTLSWASSPKKPPPGSVART